MHIRRYDTMHTAEGAPIWCYWVTTDEGQVWDVAITEEGAAYRLWIEGDLMARQPRSLYSDRQQAILAAVTAHERRAARAQAR